MTMNKKLSRLTNAAILLAAIVCGIKAVEQSNLLLLAVAFLYTFSYTYFAEK